MNSKDDKTNSTETSAPDQTQNLRKLAEEEPRVFKQINRKWQPQTKGTEQANSGGHETVLLVDDDPMTLSAVKLLLEILGHRVLDAETPGEAILLAEQHTVEIQLLVTDVVMPEMNGWNLAKKLLSLKPDLKLLFMSAYTTDVIADMGVPYGSIAFIQKPFSLNELAAKMHEVML